MKIKTDAKPVQQSLRRVPHAVRHAVSAELARLEKEGIIERVTEATEWVSPIVVVWQKEGMIRVCVDLRKVNEAVKSEKHRIPRIDTGRFTLRTDHQALTKLLCTSVEWALAYAYSWLGCKTA